MSVLRFESEEALRFTITSGLVPAEVLGRAAKTWRDEQAIVVEPEGAVPPPVLKALAAAGVGRLPQGTKSAAAREVASWAELVPLVRRNDEVDPEATVLFFVPARRSLVELAGELVRLGCDRLEYRALAGDAGHLLRAAAPPYYSVLRAIDGPSGEEVQAFVADPPGQDRLWVAAGYEHALARFLRADKDAIVLVGPTDWQTLPDGPWADIYTLIDLDLPGGKRTKLTAGTPPRVPVPLRLAHASVLDAPSLWVIREDAVTKVERLVAALPDEATRGLLFAVHETPRHGASTGPLIVLRLRPGRTAAMEIDGEPYRAHPAVGNLFLPVAATLEPPLRRDRLRDLFTPDPDQIVWLRAGEERGTFTVEETEDAAFQPLSSFIDYVIDRDRERLVPWMRGTTFDFASYVGPEERAPEAPAPAPAARKGKKAANYEDEVVEPPAPEPRAPPAPVPAPAERERLRAAPVDTNRVAEELATVERQFLALEAAADAPERLALWSRMAVLATMLRHGHDAALGFTRMIWERPDDVAVRTAWAEAEGLAVDETPTRSLLALVEPSRDHVRAVASRIVAGTDVGNATPQELSLWLDKHDEHLDVRSAWLARLSLSQLVGGDRLGLARARDRLLSRIHGGLSLERDVPAFLRRAGRSRDAAQIDLLAQAVDLLPDMLQHAKRKRTATEADPALTLAYVRFVVAYGLARLGRVERARQVRDEAVAALPASDPIHNVLVHAYVARIGQALEGLPPETALPAEVSQMLGSLVKLERYKVDRVRQASKVLEPQERLDPIAAFQRGEADPRGPEFAQLRTEADPTAIDRMVREIVTLGERSPADVKARLYDGAMDFFPSLRHERAHALLATVVHTSNDIPPPRRAQVLEEALMLAGHFGEEALAREILAVLEPTLAEVGQEGAAAIAPVAAGMLRTLRRFGLRDAAERMLTVLQSAASGKGTPSLIARLHIAGALSFLGQTDRARPVFEEALSHLKTAELQMGERLQLGRALSRSLGAAPMEYALAGLSALEKNVVVVSDSFNTNTHVCLSVLDFMEALVLGYASEELAIDPATRQHLDDDEYLVRRRIHKDLQ